MPRLQRFHQAYPQVDVSLVTGERSQGMLRPDIDVAVLFGDGRFKQGESHWLFSEEVFPVCSPLLLKERLAPLPAHALLEIVERAPLRARRLARIAATKSFLGFAHRAFGAVGTFGCADHRDGRGLGALHVGGSAPRAAQERRRAGQRGVSRQPCRFASKARATREPLGRFRCSLMNWPASTSASRSMPV